MTWQRGRPDMTVYTLELPAASGRVMDYPDGELWTTDYEEARAYAQEKKYQLIENDYEFSSSGLLEDYSQPEELDWYDSASADEGNHDQEADLDAIGSPGGASWASVAPDGRPGHKPWIWVIYNRWTDVDSEPDPTLAESEADTEAEAKAAVASWVSGHTRGE